MQAAMPIFVSCGYEYETAGEHEPAQSMTTTFRMCNVDLNEYEKAGGKKMLMQKMNDAVATATHPLPRKEGSAHEMNAKKMYQHGGSKSEWL